MTKTVNLIFFNLGKTVPLVNELSNYYYNSDRFNIEYIEEVSEVNQFLATTMNGILIFQVSTKADLQSAVHDTKSSTKTNQKRTC